MTVLALLAALICSGVEITGTVVGVTDGDTLTLLDSANVQHIIRLRSIDAPEIGHGRKRPGQPFGTKAREALAAKVFGKTVTADVDRNGGFDRERGTIFVGGRNVNLEMVREGWAWQFIRYDKSAEFRAAEQEARSSKRGLWAADSQPVPPWTWREGWRR